MKAQNPKSILKNGRQIMNKDSYFKIEGIEYFLKEVYLEYEQPELFTVCDIIGTSFLTMLISDGINEAESWLMMPVSYPRLFSLEQGEISIREAFLQPEMGVLYRVVKQQDIFEKREIKPEQLLESELPLEDARLNANETPDSQISDTLFDEANSIRKDIFDIRVDSDDTKNHTIDARQLSLLLSCVTDGVLCVAKEARKRQGVKRGLTDGCSLRYVGSRAGSFCVRLEGEESSDLLGETKLTPILSQLFIWLQALKSEDMSDFIKSVSLDVTKSLRKILKFSSDHDATIDFSFASPSKHNKVVWEKEYSRNTLIKLNALISAEERDEEYVGELVSVSTKGKSFELKSDDGDIISGEIDTSLLERKFTVKSRVKIQVKRSIKINNANETDEKFKLVDFSEIE